MQIQYLEIVAIDVDAVWVRKETTSRTHLAFPSVFVLNHGNLFFYEPYAPRIPQQTECVLANRTPHSAMRGLPPWRVADW
jgi:hypothetical protein